MQHTHIYILKHRSIFFKKVAFRKTIQISQVLFTIACYLTKDGEIKEVLSKARSCPQTWPLDYRRTKDRFFLPLPLSHQHTLLCCLVTSLPRSSYWASISDDWGLVQSK
jgi:hypothetical protein